VRGAGGEGEGEEDDGLHNVQNASVFWKNVSEFFAPFVKADSDFCAVDKEKSMQKDQIVYIFISQQLSIDLGKILSEFAIFHNHTFIYRF